MERVRGGRQIDQSEFTRGVGVDDPLFAGGELAEHEYAVNDRFACRRIDEPAHNGTGRRLCAGREGGGQGADTEQRTEAGDTRREVVAGTSHAVYDTNPAAYCGVIE